MLKKLLTDLRYSYYSYCPYSFYYNLYTLKHSRSECFFFASIRKYPNNRSVINTTFWESTSVYRSDRMTARENYFLHRGFMCRRFVDGVQSELLKNHSLRTRNDNDLFQGSQSRRQKVSWLTLPYKTFNLFYTLGNTARMHLASWNDRKKYFYTYSILTVNRLSTYCDALQTVNRASGNCSKGLWLLIESRLLMNSREIGLKRS